MGQYRDNRKKLHAILKTICNTVYYQKPSDPIQYPCIIYKYLRPNITKADNKNYKREDIYEVVYVTEDIINDVIDNIIEIDHCSFKNTFISDSLHHFVYEIYI